MTDLQKLKEVLENQAERGIKNGDWNDLKFEVKQKGSQIELTIPSVSVGFCFTSQGRLLGIFNWQG